MKVLFTQKLATKVFDFMQVKFLKCNTVDSRWLEPSGEIEKGLSYGDFKLLRVKLAKIYQKGKRIYFELAGGSSYHGFELSGVKCFKWNWQLNYTNNGNDNDNENDKDNDYHNNLMFLHNFIENVKRR